MTTITALSIVTKALYFALGYFTCKVYRRMKDLEALDEMMYLINEKLSNTEIGKHAKINGKDGE